MTTHVRFKHHKHVEIEVAGYPVRFNCYWNETKEDAETFLENWKVEDIEVEYIAGTWSPLEDLHPDLHMEVRLGIAKWREAQ